MLNSISLKVKFIIMAAVPLLAAMAFAVTLTLENYQASENARKINVLMSWAVANSQLVHELQKERGLTAGFIGSKGSEDFKRKLAAQRQLTDEKKALKLKIVSELEQEITDDMLKQIKRQNIDRLNQLDGTRRNIDNFSIPAGQAIGFYTQTNAKLLGVIKSIAETAKVSEVKQQALAYYYFVQGKERAGIERAVMSNAFATDNINLKTYLRFNELVLLQQTYIKEFNSLADQELVDFYKQAMNDSSIQTVESMRKTAHEKNLAGGFGVVGTTWFDAATARINVLKTIEDKSSAYVLDLADAQKSAAMNALSFYVFITIAVLVFCIGSGIFIARSVHARVSTLVAGLKYATSNNALNKPVELEGHDEFTFIAKEINTLFSGFRDAVIQINECSEKLAAFSEQNTVAVSQTSTALNEQKEQTYLVATAIEEMSQTINEVSGNTVETATAVAQADQIATSSQDVVSNSIEQIQHVAENVSQVHEIVAKLNESSTEITNVVDVIKSVAEQTNLLALNAAIEAARAGEQGRGFAVVADEVRTLAQRTQESTQQIEDIINQFAQETGQAFNLISECQENAQSSVTSSNDITTAINEIKQSIDSIEQMANQIATASEEQVVVANEISQNVGEISVASDESAKASDDIAATSQEQADLAKGLQQLASEFRV